MKAVDIRAVLRREIAGGASQARVAWLAIRHTTRRYPRRVPSWTTASYKRAQAKKRRVKAARRGGR